MCQPKPQLQTIPQASTKAAPPPEETALGIVTGKEQQEDKKKGVKSLQTYDNGASPLAISKKTGGLNVPKV